jgi:hypothetical protein
MTFRRFWEHAHRKFLPLTLLILPPLVGIVLFALAAMLLDAGDAFGIGDKTDGQNVVAALGTYIAIATSFIFSTVWPLAALAALVVLVKRHARAHTEDATKK